MVPSAGSITIDVRSAGPTRPFCVSSQISFNSPLVGTPPATRASRRGSAERWNSAASSGVKTALFPNSFGRSSGTGVWFV
jgi:hypothetical protein